MNDHRSLGDQTVQRQSSGAAIRRRTGAKRQLSADDSRSSCLLRSVREGLHWFVRATYGGRSLRFG
jgi:hypothetical protein